MKLPALLIFVLATGAQAQMFKCEGGERVVYSNQPCPAGQRESEIEGTRASAARMTKQRESEEAAAARQRAALAPILARQRQREAELDLVHRCASGAANPSVYVRLMEACTRMYSSRQEPPPASPRAAANPPAGAVDVRTGQFLPGVAGGVVSPRSGQFYPDVGPGYVDPRSGAFIPKH